MTEESSSHLQHRARQSAGSGRLSHPDSGHRDQAENVRHFLATGCRALTVQRARHG